MTRKVDMNEMSEKNFRMFYTNVNCKTKKNPAFLHRIEKKYMLSMYVFSNYTIKILMIIKFEL